MQTCQLQRLVLLFLHPFYFWHFACFTRDVLSKTKTTFIKSIYTKACFVLLIFLSLLKISIMRKPTFSLLFIPLLAVVLLCSCVATRKYKDSQAALQSARSDSARLANQVNELQNNINQLNSQISTLTGKNTDLQNQLKAVANEAANKGNLLQQSQGQLADQQKKLQQLQAILDQQKQKSEALRKKMADALGGFSSNELTVTQKNGRVYVSLQENLLFPSGSAVVNPKGKQALSQLAQVLNVNPDISVNIEGHTDSIPIRGRYEDNWALSVARATSIVRVLVNDYKVDPARVVASGHSSYDPVDTNSTPEGRAKNRRTEIILSPKLDELYQLLQQ